ncbi:MAG: rhomboid family intramembrane serine protease [Desulfuromonadales bacterium]|nr:rhomboid family intramembrane serine protease [Desulfuromonadales bacterium]
MFFPIADTPKPPGRPYVTWGLMAINIAVFLLISFPATRASVDLTDPLLLEYLRSLGLYGRVSAQEVLTHLSAHDLLVFKYGFRPAAASLPTLLSSLFLHGGLMHLAGNMMFLYIFGNNVEYRLGHWRYLLVYLGCGVAATLFFTLFSLRSHIPLIGASGAIFGVLGCYFLWFPKNRVRCLIFLFPFVVTTILLPARLLLGFYLLIDNLLPFIVSGTQGSGIAHGAHIGGFLAGLGVAWGGNHYRQLFPQRPASESRRRHTPLESLRRICPAINQANLDQAAHCYFSLNSREERQQVATADLLAVGNYLLAQERNQEALILFRRLIAERPRDVDLAQAYLGGGQAMVKNPRYLTSAYHYFLAAIDLSSDEELIARARAYLRSIEEGGPFTL